MINRKSDEMAIEGELSADLLNMVQLMSKCAGAPRIGDETNLSM